MLKIEPHHAFYAALFYLLLNFVSGPLSILFGSALAFYIIWQARPEFIPALIILHTDRSSFVLAGYGSWDYALESFQSGSLVIAGLPFTVTYVIAAAILLRVSWEFIIHRETFSRSGLIWLVLPWAIGLVLAAIMTYQAYMGRNPSWTLNMRVFMMLGCIFYGAILMRNWRSRGDWLIDWLVPIFTVFYFLATIGRFHSHMLWVFTGMAIPLAWLAMRRRGLWHKGIGFLCLVGVVLYGLGIGPGMAAVTHDESLVSGLMGSGSSTFTLNALLLFSIVVAIVAALPKGKFREFVAWFLGLPAFLTILTFTFVIAWLSPQFAYSGSTAFRTNISAMTVVERVQFKIFDDRSVIWHGLLKNVLQEDPILRPTGELIFIEYANRGLVVWPHGGHNAFVEALRQGRWVAGSVVILFIAVVMIKCAKVIGKPLPASLRAVAAGIIAVSVVANTTGHSVVMGEGAFFYFTFAGIVIAAIAEVKHRNESGARSKA